MSQDQAPLDRPLEEKQDWNFKFISRVKIEKLGRIGCAGLPEYKIVQDIIHQCEMI